MELQLLVKRKLIELSSQGKLPIDFFLANIEVLDVEKAYVLSRVRQLICQLLFAARLVELAEI